MGEDGRTCSCCYRFPTRRNSGIEIEMIEQDPALGHHKMAATEEGASKARHASEERRGPAYARASEPDAGIPGHVGVQKQLHSATGYNLVIDTEGNIYGTREPYNNEAILEVTSRAPGEVQIKGKKAKMYLAMNEKGKVYAEEKQESENTWFKELYEDGWNNYVWLGNKKEWFLGIKKSGKVKRGPKTKRGQKAVKFVPRSAVPNYT